MSATQLPQDLLERCLEPLGTRDRLAFLSACKGLRAQGLASASLWADLRVWLKSSEAAQSLAAWLAPAGAGAARQVQQLCLVFGDAGADEELSAGEGEEQEDEAATAPSGRRSSQRSRYADLAAAAGSTADATLLAAAAVHGSLHTLELRVEVPESEQGTLYAPPAVLHIEVSGWGLAGLRHLRLSCSSGDATWWSSSPTIEAELSATPALAGLSCLETLSLGANVRLADGCLPSSLATLQLRMAVHSWDGRPTLPPVVAAATQLRRLEVDADYNPKQGTYLRCADISRLTGLTHLALTSGPASPLDLRPLGGSLRELALSPGDPPRQYLALSDVADPACWAALSRLTYLRLGYSGGEFKGEEATPQLSQLAGLRALEVHSDGDLATGTLAALPGLTALALPFGAGLYWEPSCGHLLEEAERLPALRALCLAGLGGPDTEAEQAQWKARGVWCCTDIFDWRAASLPVTWPCPF